LTSVVFSLMPVSFETFLIRLSSMFKVVLILPPEISICINMHDSCIFCQGILNSASNGFISNVTEAVVKGDR
jgi:hypothetical protein